MHAISLERQVHCISILDSISHAEFETKRHVVKSQCHSEKQHSNNFY